MAARLQVASHDVWRVRKQRDACSYLTCFLPSDQNLSLECTFSVRIDLPTEVNVGTLSQACPEV